MLITIILGSENAENKLRSAVVQLMAPRYCRGMWIPGLGFGLIWGLQRWTSIGPLLGPIFDTSRVSSFAARDRYPAE